MEEQGHTPSRDALCQYLAGEGGLVRLRFAAREAEIYSLNG
jgi:hypothetical protein